MHIHIKSPADGLSLNTMVICDTSSPKAVILFIHGLCGKIDRMLPTMQHFSDTGFACACFDMRGHGNSVRKERDRGYTYKGGSKAMAADIKSVVEWLHIRYPKIPSL